jgi:Spy/CpxP family protein refolding chaperone
MTKFPLVLALVAAATVATAEARGWAGRGGGSPGVMPEISRELFPPELVMRHQEEIGLSEDQKSKLVHAMQAMQSDLVPLQFEMGEAAGKLREALSAPRIDEEKAGGLADKLMALETQIKRRHLTTMIRIKNVLTPDQQERLRALREQEPHGRDARRGDRPSPPDGGGAPPQEPED